MNITNLLSVVADNVEESVESIEKLTPVGFEHLVVEVLKRYTTDTVQYNEGSTGFPDVVFSWESEKIGLEIKLSRSGSWKTIGNSIMEGTAKSVSRIFLFFGKIDKDSLTIRCKDYEKCIDDIVVTHSPRYHIDMDLSADRTIFKRMNSTYENFRKLDDSRKISEVKSYYTTIKASTGHWWIDDIQETNKSMAFTIQLYSDLPAKRKDDLFIQIFARFPQIIQQGNPVKYIDAVVWLTKQGIVHSSFRDIFSAGGKTVIPGIMNDAPQVIYKMYQNRRAIASEVNKLTNEEIQAFLSLKSKYSSFTKNNAWDAWKEIVAGYLDHYDNITPLIARKLLD
jgi:hypothetical protein